MATIKIEKRGVWYWSGVFLTVALVAVLLAAIAATTHIIANTKPVDRYTELYLLGPEGKADSYPSELVVGENKTLVAGVTNHEQAPVAYDLFVRYDNGTVEKTVYVECIDLADNASWQKPFLIAPDIPGDRVRISFDLYRDGDLSSPYRECHIWMNVSLPYDYGKVPAK